jgi:hypothetical protein
MKRISIRIGVAVLAFFVGFVASTVRLRFSAGSRKSASSFSSRDEEWHRLYEAAGLSGDATIMKEVSDRLLCTNNSGVPDAWPVEGGARCQRSDGTIHQLYGNDTTGYGSFFRRTISSQNTWAIENLDFVRTISTGKTAKEYVATHEWPLSK